MKARAGAWTLAATTVAALFFVLAVRRDVYEATSPHWLSWHIVLRKCYSIAAFTIVGYLLRRSLLERGAVAVTLPCVLGIAAYSACIEYGQYLTGVREGLNWNAVDIACGACGGALAVADLIRGRSRKEAREG